jgi:hypothetical protein
MRCIRLCECRGEVCCRLSRNETRPGRRADAARALSRPDSQTHKAPQEPQLIQLAGGGTDQTSRLMTD